MKEFVKNHIPTLISLLLVVPIGFFTKFYSGYAENWVNNELGGVFYEIFWCLFIFLFLPQISPWKIAIWVFGGTCVLEFMQLWHPPILELFRSNFIGRTILGNSFSMRDFPYYLIGSVMGWFWVRRLQNEFWKKEISEAV